jgi:hypothetical protein
VPGKRIHFTIFRLLPVIGLLLVALSTHTFAQSGKRLILKDGTWQEITQYEVRGDRARYFSSQRGEWEEVPKTLVDWKATEEWNKGLKEKAGDLRELDAEDEEAGRKAESANTPAVATGLNLPVTGGVFLLDAFSAQPSLDELAQSGSARSRDLRTGVNRRASFKQHFELKGPHAHVQAHVTAPEIFVKVDEDQDAQPIALPDRFRILKLESQRDSRVLASVEVSVLGKQNQSQQFIATRVESFSEGWLKITSLGTLEPGEYALVEMLGQSEFNAYVWDFGVDPNAPANPHSRKPESPANGRDR